MLSAYELSANFYDEMLTATGGIRDHYAGVCRVLSGMDPVNLSKRQQIIENQIVREGVTFTLYNGGGDALERTIPFDIIPRIVSATEWKHLEQGLTQRVKAINLFLHDIYHEQNILKDEIIPRKMIVTNCYFRPEMVEMDVPGGTYIPFSGIDLIRDTDGTYYILEDNLRSPSGISYLFKNRALMRRLFPELFQEYQVQSLSYSVQRFLTTLRSLAPGDTLSPKVVLLTPGCYNSAYYEHTYLARKMGIDLVEGRDLTVIDHYVYLKTMQGLEKVDVIYRRIDDDFLDPIAFRPDSVLGVPGLMNAYRAGNVAIANAPGTGVADDKAIYTYVPEMIRYYLQEEPIIPNVPTYIMSNKKDRELVLSQLDKMVVKETSLSGGYGMLIGPHATEKEREDFARNIMAAPDKYIAQPTINLSCVPSLYQDTIVPRHVDLRPYILMDANQEVHVVPGGLTRVALKPGSLVVNSSQGGGSKDTWVLKEAPL